MMANLNYDAAETLPENLKEKEKKEQLEAIEKEMLRIRERRFKKRAQ